MEYIYPTLYYHNVKLVWQSDHHYEMCVSVVNILCLTVGRASLGVDIRPLIDSVLWYHSRQVSKGIAPAPRSHWTHRNYTSPPSVFICRLRNTVFALFQLSNSGTWTFSIFSVIRTPRKGSWLHKADCWSLFLPSLIFCRLYWLSWVGPGQCSSSSFSCSDY